MNPDPYVGAEHVIVWRGDLPSPFGLHGKGELLAAQRSRTAPIYLDSPSSHFDPDLSERDDSFEPIRGRRLKPARRFVSDLPIHLF